MIRRAFRASLILAVGGIAALTLGAAAARGEIVLQESIAGITLGEDVGEVIAGKGPPDRDRVVANENIGQIRKLVYGRTKAVFAGPGDDAVAITITTRGRGQRTSDGLGVGSTQARLEAAIPRLDCPKGGPKFCLLPASRPSGGQTLFKISRRTGRVTRVVVATPAD